MGVILGSWKIKWTLLFRVLGLAGLGFRLQGLGRVGSKW